MNRIMVIEATHRNAATREPMEQYTRMDLRNEDDSFILFWNRSTIHYLDDIENQIAKSRAERSGRVVLA